MSIHERSCSHVVEGGSARRIWALTVCCFLSVALLCQSGSSQTSAPSKVESPLDQGAVPASGKKAGIVQPIDSQGAPRIVLDSTTHDFDQIRPSSTNTVSFRLTNTGGGTLKITDVKQCCGTVAKIDKKELGPGENAVLTVECNAGQAAGKLSKKIGIVTNDPKNPQTELTITGEVVPTLLWAPTRFEIAAYKENVVCPEITIKSLDSTAFALKGFSATGQCLTADFDPCNEARELTLKPRVDRVKLIAAEFSTGRVRIDLAHRDYQAIELDFDIKPAIGVTPPRIMVFNAEAGKPVLRTLQLQDNRTDSTGDLSGGIESVAFKNGARVEMRGVTKIGRGCEMNLALWPASERKNESFWNDQLLVRLKGGPLLSVPVHVFYKVQSLSGEKSPPSSS